MPKVVPIHSPGSGTCAKGAPFLGSTSRLCAQVHPVRVQTQIDPKEGSEKDSPPLELLDDLSDRLDNSFNPCREGLQ